MRARIGSSSEHGSATAELVVCLPAVALLVITCIAGVNLASVRAGLQDAAADAARLAARGEPIAGRATVLAPGARIVIADSPGDMVCATASRQVSAGSLPSFELEASSCALGGGR